MTRAKTGAKGTRTEAEQARGTKDGAQGQHGAQAQAGATERREPFAQTLRGLLALSLDLDAAHETAAEAPASTPSPAIKQPNKVSLTAAAVVRLKQALNALDSETAAKVFALVQAGGQGCDIRVAHATGEANAELRAQVLRDKRVSFADKLRRGLAIAFATDFDLEAPLAEWPESSGSTLEERVWLSFGRQLAQSRLSEWRCLGISEPGRAKELTKLYLRRDGKAWWSFRAVLDRPSPAAVHRQQQAGRGGKSPRIAIGSLESIAEQASDKGGSALRRALRAVRARVGVLDGAEFA